MAGKPKKQLVLDQREFAVGGFMRDWSACKIAKALSVVSSTVSREVKTKQNGS